MIDFVNVCGNQGPQSELGVGENFGVGGAFAKWGAVGGLDVDVGSPDKLFPGNFVWLAGISANDI